MRGAPTKYILGHQRPNLKERYLEIDEDLAFIVGYYASEGNLGYRREGGLPDRVQFSFGIHEKETLARDCAERLTRLGYRPRVRLRHSVCLVFVHDTYFARMLRALVGVSAHRKQYSQAVMQWPTERLHNVLEAHWRGDGYEFQQDGSTLRSITTVSPAMARQLRDIAVMVGLRPSLRKRKSAASFIANNRRPTVPRQGYEVRWVASAKTKYRGLENGSLVAYRTKLKSRAYAGTVYNLEVEEDNSYSTACYVVHNCEPDLFGEELAKLGIIYGHALIACEANKDGGTVNVRLRNDGYPHLYYRQEIDRRTNRKTARLGWMTSSATKPLMINSLAQAINDGAEIPSKETIGEMMTFVYHDDGRLGAQQGCHDDRVISSAIVQEVRKRQGIESIYPSAGGQGENH